MIRGELTPSEWLAGFRGKTLVAGDCAGDHITPALLSWAQVLELQA